MWRTELLSILKTASDAFKLALPKIASKKTAAFVIATHLTYREILQPEHWLTIALLFMGVEGILAYKKLIQEVQNAPTGDDS